MTDKKNFYDDIGSFLSAPNDKSTYEERVGPPDEFHAVIGRISINFSALEETLSSCITKILGQSEDIGNILTAELSFKNKIVLFSSLYLKLKNQIKFNEYEGFELEHFKLITKALNQAEQLRNQVIHSKFVVDTNKLSNNITRTKITSKQRLGLKIINEKTNVIELFNIADFLIAVAYAVDEFCILENE